MKMNILNQSFAMRIALLVIILITSTRSFTQDTARVRWNQQVKTALNMPENQYSQYITVNDKYIEQFKQINRDPSLDRNSRIVAIQKVVTERREAINQLLTEDQRNKLTELESQRATDKNSPFYKHQQKQEGRMKQWTQERARTDSTRLKSTGQ
jgi:hypothetical protein